jgi:anti-sigma B factor antagonist
MAIEIGQEQQGAVRILALAGRLDTETAADVELALQDLLAAGERQFLIDLAGIGYVSSAGLRVLLALAKQLDGGKGSLRLCGLNASVRQVFDVAGFSKLFAIFPNRDAALGQPPALKPEAILAQQAARLLGVVAGKESPHAQSDALARAAAAILSLKPALARAPAASSVSMRPVVAPAVPSAPAAGFIDKLRRMFGGKKS